jgi:tetratricopeptide (TPR) repeat protein
MIGSCEQASSSQKTISQSTLKMHSGNVEYEKKNYDEAIKQFSEGLQLSPLSPMEELWCHVMIARCHYHKGNAEKALEYLDSIQEKFANNTSIDSETSATVKTRALARIYSEKPRMLHSLKRYEEELAAFELSKQYWVALRDESQIFSGEEKQISKLEEENGIDLKIALLLEEIGRSNDAAERYQHIVERYKRLQTLYKTESKRQDPYRQYIVNVFINKKIGDCLKDRSYYQKALQSYLPTITDELKKRLGNKFIEKSEIQALCQ